MRITSIEINSLVDRVLCVGQNEKKLYALNVTTKNWFGKEKKFKAYPTSYGPTYGGKNVLFHMFVDENGPRWL